jgi:hypothetical protein
MCIYCATNNYRKVYKVHNGPIPIDQNGKRYHIHHIDGNRANNHFTNLIALSIEDHYQIHFDQQDWNACIKLYAQMGKSNQETSELAQTLSKQYGWKPPSQKGKRYWTNGLSNTMSTESPGKDWWLGKTIFCDKTKYKEKISAIKKAEMTREKRELLRQKSLSNDSCPPNQTGKKHWTNGVENTMAFESPGPDWRPGLTHEKAPHCTGLWAQCPV